MTAQNILFQKIKIKAASTPHEECLVEEPAKVSRGSNLYRLFWSNDYTTHDLIEKQKSTVKL